MNEFLVNAINARCALDFISLLPMKLETTHLRCISSVWSTGAAARVAKDILPERRDDRGCLTTF
jgi:hypothetical protein